MAANHDLRALLREDAIEREFLTEVAGSKTDLPDEYVR